jgi:DNA-binding SARP family transcriptional activator
MSEAQTERPVDGRAIYQLLDSGAYEQAAGLLHEMQVASPATTAGRSDVIAIAAVREICLACLQCQAEIEWHRQASQATERREQQLKNHAQTMLGWISRQETSGLEEVRSPTELFTPKSSTPEFTVGEPGKPTSLRQRIQDICARAKRALSGHKQISPLSTERIGLPQLTIALNAEQKTEELPPAPVEEEESTVAPPLARAEEPVADAHAPAVEVPMRPSEPTSVAFVIEAETPVASPFEPEEPLKSGPPALAVYCLGAFRVFQNDQPIEGWPSSKSQSLFKYLITHREHPVAKEVLMDRFWLEAAPEAARNNLNVAIHGLRRALREGHPGFSHVLFQNDAYLLNPELRIWVDVEEFGQHFRTGQRLEQAKELAQAVLEYRAAEALYQGEFLEEDRYEDWLLPRRQSLQDDYLTLLDRLSRHYLEQESYDACVLMCGKLLAIDSCREDAHRRLMRCYSRQGQYHLALRQYHFCVEALQHELEVEPDEATQALFRQIREHRAV